MGIVKQSLAAMEVSRPGNYGQRHSQSPHSFTEVTYSRDNRRAGGSDSLAGSCASAAFGVVLLLAGSVGLWWNEGVAVRTYTMISEAEYALSLPSGGAGAL